MGAFGGVLLALACWSVVPIAAASSSAKPSGSFLSVELPGRVEHASGVRETVVGDIEHHTASSRSGDAELSITASTLPSFVTSVATDDMLYRKARNELLRSFSAERRSWGSCTHAGYACRALSYGTGDGRKGLARLYLQGDVLVVTNAVYDEDEAMARRFLASAR
jgi:hypothetical protein